MTDGETTMFMSTEFLSTPTLAPQSPLPPEIEGFLKKLKRKTSNLTGSWNKRWFFVDPKRLEFGYAASKAPNAAKSSIYLNDITAVIQFDDTHFQVESRTRNFFLCGESKASTSCWVKSLDEYRKKLIEYEREMLQLKVAAPPTSAAPGIASSNQVKPGVSSQKQREKKHDNPARDSLQDSSSSASLSQSVSSSSNLADEKLPRHGNVDDAKRTPLERSRRRDSRDAKPRETSGTAKADRMQERDRDADKKTRDRGRDRDGERERERERSSRDRGKHRDRDTDRSSSSQRRANTPSGSGTSPSSSQATGGRTNSRTNSGKSLYAAHPSHGYVMHAWMDEFE